MIFKSMKFKRNSKKLLSICVEYASQYEKFNAKIAPSCIPDLKQSISQLINNVKKEISEWDDSDTDYHSIAHSLLSNTTFDLLASGHYHLFYGILNPMNCSSNLMTVYIKSMEWAVKQGKITDKEKEEQYAYLIKSISQVG